VAAERLRDGAMRPISPGHHRRNGICARFRCAREEFAQRPASVDASVNFGGRDDETTRPVAVGIERHKFDETHDYAALARKFCEGFDFIVR